MDEPKEADTENQAKKPKTEIREFKEFKLNGIPVHGDNDAPCDAEFEWMPDNGD